MENTNFSSSNQESTSPSPSPKLIHRVRSLPTRVAKPVKVLDVSPKSSNNVGISQHNLIPSPKPHVRDDKGKEIAVDGRERLKRHREEVAGRVMIPDKWSEENLLRDWMDHSSFDKLLAPKGLASAREALIAQGKSRPSSQRLRIESRC